MELRVATGQDIDDFIEVASRHFFSGSEARARENLGHFVEADTSFMLAYDGGEPVGVVTVRWNCQYPPFLAEGIPFIQNIEIRHDLRGRGVGSRVMEAVEQFVGRRTHRLGICVALFDAYGPAQRLYAKRGYVPDGRGACQRFTPLRRGDRITLDDDHLIWLVKELHGAPGVRHRQDVSS